MGIEFDLKTISDGRGIKWCCDAVDEIAFDHKISCVTGSTIMRPEIKACMFEIFESVLANGDALGVIRVRRYRDTSDALEEVFLDDDIVCSPNSDCVNSILGGSE